MKKIAFIAILALATSVSVYAGEGEKKGKKKKAKTEKCEKTKCCAPAEGASNQEGENAEAKPACCKKK